MHNITLIHGGLSVEFAKASYSPYFKSLFNWVMILWWPNMVYIHVDNSFFLYIL